MFAAVLLALALATLLLFVFARIASRNADKVNLGSKVFDLGSAKKRIPQARLAPLQFNDLVRDNRQVALAVVYLGDNRWAALNTIAPGATPECATQWNPDSRVWVDPCNGNLYAPDGGNTTAAPLEQFVAEVTAKGRLVIDLNRKPERAPEAS